MSASKMIVLKSSDGQNFEVEEAVALESLTIKHAIEVTGASTIPLPKVTSEILAKVIEYCEKYVEASTKSSDEDLMPFDSYFVKLNSDFVKLDQGTLFDLILAANYLNIKSLLDLACETVAEMIKGKTPEEISKTFNIDSFTPAEEEEIRRENAWAFE